MTLTAEQILKARPKIAKVDTADWIEGVDAIYAASLSTGQCKAFQELVDPEAESGDIELLARVCMWGACDEQGQRIFADDQLSDVMGMPYALVEAVAKSVLNLSGLHRDMQDALEKN